MDENKTKYLYGAAVQGIQEFIFQTNSLKDIVGASELVERVCTNLFDEVLKTCVIEKEDSNAIIMAAGNIKYIFDSKEQCEKVVRIFPKTVTEAAPGITISQAVVSMKEEKFGDAVQELENRLRTQRNRPMRSTTIGLMGIERSRQTGLPVTRVLDKEQHLDEGTYLKLYEDKNRKETTRGLCEKAFGKGDWEGRIAFDIAHMTGINDWIAIIHADGNGLGQVVQRVGGDQEKLKQFSQKLDEATTNAAVEAFKSLGISDNLKIPMRPIVLSGDDHTVICRADLALDYVKAFIENFEKQTGELLGKSGLLQSVFKSGEKYLTACAGIAFIKSSYPFYYGYQLAETLCDRAKKDTKVLYKADDGYLPASCVMFHKVQDSFIASYDDIVKRELTPQENISFEFGPYYIISVEREDRWTLKRLLKKSFELDAEDMRPVKAGLRNWLSLLHVNPEMAAQRLERLKYISGKGDYIYKVTKPRKESCKDVYPVYDILAVNSINTKDTKAGKEEAK